MERNDNSEWTDCVFIFEDRKIAAHKLILSYTSPVFKSMFYGSLASPEINISDIDSKDFDQMLQYIYTEKVVLSSVSNAWSLLYISQKYFINDLKSICADYIHSNLTITTLLLSYEYALLYNLNHLLNKCWRDILLTAKEVLQVDYHMKATTFCSLLDESEINATENDLVEAAIKWSEDECIFQSMDPTHENRLKVLTGSGIFARLRFGCLSNSPQYLYQLLVSKEDLSECIDTTSKERNKMPYLIKYRFRETYKIERNLLLDSSNEFSSLITTPRELIVYGIAITPPHKDGFQEARTNVIISVFDDKSNLLSQAVDVIKVISDYEIPHLVNLSSGVKFNAFTTYKISVKYVCDGDLNKPELLCFYLSPSINTHANSLSVQFDDQLYGGLVRGISFYVL